jgi:phage-related protein
VSNAIWNVIDPSLKLVEYNLKAITGGTDALADVSIKLSDESDNIYIARALDEDVIKASVKAIIKGINKALNYKERTLQNS